MWMVHVKRLLMWWYLLVSPGREQKYVEAVVYPNWQDKGSPPTPDSH